MTMSNVGVEFSLLTEAVDNNIVSAPDATVVIPPHSHPVARSLSGKVARTVFYMVKREGSL